ncbi:hypothetical protein HRbin30_02373 [bacterium HR30]|nr:hypothetical protein HRbin30_02373 [bacterium HR30]
MIPNAFRILASGFLIERTQASSHIAPQFCIGHARFLKIQDIVEAPLGHLPHDRQWRHRQSRKERGVHPDHAGYAVRRQQGHLPGHQATPVMAYDHGFLDLERVKQACKVSDQMMDRILPHFGRRARLAVATLIRSDRTVTSPGQGSQLMAPRVPDLGESMAQKHRKPLSGFYSVDANPVCIEVAVRKFRHSSTLPRFPRWSNPTAGWHSPSIQRRVSLPVCGLLVKRQLYT